MKYLILINLFTALLAIRSCASTNATSTDTDSSGIEGDIDMSETQPMTEGEEALMWSNESAAAPITQAEELITQIEVGEQLEIAQIPDGHMIGRIMLCNQSGLNGIIFQLSLNAVDWEKHILDHNGYEFYKVNDKGEVFVRLIFRKAEGIVSLVFRLKERKKYYIDWDATVRAYTVKQYIEE